MWTFKDTLWNFTQNILPIRWKIWFLYNIEILRALRFKSSYGFLKRPPGVWHRDVRQLHGTGGQRVPVETVGHDAAVTHWSRERMAAISQTTFSNAFSWMKIYEFRLKFHWSLFPRVQLTIFQHWFRQWLGADQATSHYMNQWWLIYWRIYASMSKIQPMQLNAATTTTTGVHDA